MATESAVVHALHMRLLCGKAQHTCYIHPYVPVRTMHMVPGCSSASSRIAGKPSLSHSRGNKLLRTPQPGDVSQL